MFAGNNEASTHIRAFTSVQTPSPACRVQTLQRKGLFLALLFGVAVVPALADPIAVSFSATQVAGSEWRYSYRLAGSLSAGDDLAIYFPLSTSSSLQAGSSADPNVTTFVLQPDPLLPADGEFDIVAGISDPSLTSPFSVDFLYSGTGSPGTQAFSVFDSSFNQISSGTTTAGVAPAPVPEPGSLALLGSGALTLWHIRRRSRP